MLRAWIKGSLVMIVSSAFFCSLPLISSAQDIFIEEDVLTLAQCIKIALQVHPDVVGAQKKVEAQESRVGQASSQNYPTPFGLDQLRQKFPCRRKRPLQLLKRCLALSARNGFRSKGDAN